MRLAFANFAPDLPALSGGMDKAFNVLPAAQSYRPVSGLTAYASNALTARCQGMAAYLDSTGAVQAFAGDATKLYRLTAGATTWADVSGATYTIPTDTAWNFAIYGNRVVAIDYTDAPQTFLMGTDVAFSNLSAGAPKARVGDVAKNFLMLGNTNDASDGAVPNRLWWSKQGDITTWPTPASAAAIAALSGKVDLAGDVGQIQCLKAGLQGADILAVSERGLHRGIFTGDANIWTFDLIEGARGTPAPNSGVLQGGLFYFLGQDGFYVTNGIQATPIGSNVIDKFFYGDTTYGVDVSSLYRVTAVADPINKIIMWSYPSVSSSGGTPDTIICYNWDIGRWSLIPGLGNIELLARMYSLGYSLDTLDTLSSSIDSLAFSLDSRQLTGGKLLIGAFTTGHVLSTFTGANLAATLTTSESGHPTGQMMAVGAAFPLIEGTSVAPTVTPLTRDRQVDALTTGTASVMNTTGLCPLRTDSRYLALEVDIPAGSTWTHAVGVDIPDDEIAVTGSR